MSVLIIIALLLIAWLGALGAETQLDHAEAAVSASVRVVRREGPRLPGSCAKKFAGLAECSAHKREPPDGTESVRPSSGRYADLPNRQVAIAEEGSSKNSSNGRWPPRAGPVKAMWASPPWLRRKERIASSPTPRPEIDVSAVAVETPD
jgi:hypothetical protein